MMHHSSHRSARALIVAGVVVLSALLSACSGGSGGTSSSGSSGKPIKFGFIVQAGTSPFAALQIQAAKAEAKKVGVDLLTADVQKSDSLAITTLQQFISQGAQGIIMVPPTDDIGPTVLRIAKKANIPVIADEQELKDASGKATYFNGLDNVAIGKVSGEQLAASMKKLHPDWNTPDTALLVDTTKTEPACNQRTDNSVKSFMAGIGGKFNGQVLSIDSDDTATGALKSMQAALANYGSVKNWIITSCNDDGVVGVLQALEAKGITKANSLGWGTDGSLACTQLVKDNGFYGATYVDFYQQGIDVFNTMYKHLKNGTPIPQVANVKSTPITRDNYKAHAHC